MFRSFKPLLLHRNRAAAPARGLMMTMKVWESEQLGWRPVQAEVVWDPLPERRTTVELKA